MSCSLYHIRRAEHTSLSDGYVGISTDVATRWARHKAGYSGSVVLNRAYTKYDDIVEDVLLEASEQTCRYFEMLLRPEQRVGWNLAIGGGNPPSHLGKVMSEEQKAKIGISNGGKNNVKWKGYWVVDGVRYVSSSVAAKHIGCTKRTIMNRVKSDSFPNYWFEPST